MSESNSEGGKTLHLGGCDGRAEERGGWEDVPSGLVGELGIEHGRLGGVGPPKRVGRGRENSGVSIRRRGLHQGGWEEGA